MKPITAKSGFCLLFENAEGKSIERPISDFINAVGAENPPLTWVSLEGMQEADGFEKERDELNLAYPDTDVCKKAVVAYIETVRQHNMRMVSLLESDAEIPSELADRVPDFPQPFYDEWASRTETATHTLFYAQPTTALVDGIGSPEIETAVSLDLTEWPMSLQDITTRLGAVAGKQ